MLHGPPQNLVRTGFFPAVLSLLGCRQVWAPSCREDQGNSLSHALRPQPETLSQVLHMYRGRPRGRENTKPKTYFFSTRNITALLPGPSSPALGFLLSPGPLVHLWASSLIPFQPVHHFPQARDVPETQIPSRTFLLQTLQGQLSVWQRSPTSSPEPASCLLDVFVNKDNI